MRKKIVITGGSSGIGLAAADIFASHNYDIFITSLDSNELNSAMEKLRISHPGISIKGMTADLTSADQIHAFYDNVCEEMKDPDVVMHNAGFGTYGFIDDIPIEKEEKMLSLMVMGLYRSTRLFLHQMLQRNEGVIINISSISAFQPNPTLATYGACKSFVYQFSRAINEELKDRKSNVRCITICPTPVRTNFQANAGMQHSSLFDSWMTCDANFVARQIYDACTRKNDWAVPGKIFHFLSVLSDILPERVRIYLAKWHLKPKK